MADFQMPNTPPMNHTARRNSMVMPNYYSAGYPVHFEAMNKMAGDDEHAKGVKYSNVVNELRDSKL